MIRVALSTMRIGIDWCEPNRTTRAPAMPMSTITSRSRNRSQYSTIKTLWGSWSRRSFSCESTVPRGTSTSPIWCSTGAVRIAQSRLPFGSPAEGPSVPPAIASCVMSGITSPA